MVAKSAIARHRLAVMTVSVAAGAPGGWWMAGTIPADLSQFTWHVATISQKLAYLHGWPELMRDGEDVDDETLLILTVFAGVMYGAAGATKVLGELGQAFAQEVARRVPRMALTQIGLYTLAVEVAKWIGIRLTKSTFAIFLSKAIPIVSGGISGGISWFAFQSMSRKLQRHLEQLHLHAPSEAL